MTTGSENLNTGLDNYPELLIFITEDEKVSFPASPASAVPSGLPTNADGFFLPYWFLLLSTKQFHCPSLES